MTAGQRREQVFPCHMGVERYPLEGQRAWLLDA